MFYFHARQCSLYSRLVYVGTYVSMVLMVGMHVTMVHICIYAIMHISEGRSLICIGM